MQTVQSAPSAARLRGIRAASAYDARGRSSHNPPVVGSSPTRPTCGLLPGKRAGPTFGTSPPHICLVWALEYLAWSSAHMSRVAATLVRLAKIDPEPDANTHPRPAGSPGRCVQPLRPADVRPVRAPPRRTRRAAPSLTCGSVAVATCDPAHAPDNLHRRTVRGGDHGLWPARDLSVDLFGHRPRLPGHRSAGPHPVRRSAAVRLPGGSVCRPRQRGDHRAPDRRRVRVP